jgi:hypothetical protein
MTVIAFKRGIIINEVFGLCTIVGKIIKIYAKATKE